MVRLIARESLASVVIGAALGLGGAMLATSVIESMLLGVTRVDGPTFAAAVAVITGAAALAA